MFTDKIPGLRVYRSPDAGGAAGGGAAAPAAAPAGGAAPPAQGTTAPITLPPEFSDWGKSKGYNEDTMKLASTNPEVYKVMSSYREAEKMIGQLNGADRISLPKDMTDRAAMDAVYAKLGRPNAATDYKFEVPQGGDNQFALKAGEVFHKVGLNQTQVAEINKWWNAEATAVQERMKADRTTRDNQQIEALNKEWGGDAAGKKEIATRGGKLAAEKLGITESMQEAMADAIGVGPTTKLLHMLGDLAKLAGDKFEGGGPGQRDTGLSMTPEQATARIELLKKDTTFQEKRKKGDAASVSEWKQLHEIKAKGLKA